MLGFVALVWLLQGSLYAWCFLLFLRAAVGLRWWFRLVYACWLLFTILMPFRSCLPLLSPGGFFLPPCAVPLVDAFEVFKVDFLGCFFVCVVVRGACSCLFPWAAHSGRCGMYCSAVDLPPNCCSAIKAERAGSQTRTCREPAGPSQQARCGSEVLHFIPTKVPQCALQWYSMSAS